MWQRAWRDKVLPAVVCHKPDPILFSAGLDARPSLALTLPVSSQGTPAGPQSAMWRRAWRDKILPAVVRHKPDLILISAGFDAHRRDEINHGFVALQERDYSWLTDQLVQVCCCARPYRSVCVSAALACCQGAAAKHLDCSGCGCSADGGPRAAIAAVRMGFRLA